jgi:sterol desaturase/sphingolipid hydroxylase (fatty acid hydroxylase superfamily)
MSPNPIAFAIPIFFLLMGLELVASRFLRRPVYRLTDAFSDLGCGITQQVVGALWATPLFAAYASVHARAPASAGELGSPFATWTVAILAVDFMYYWWHRTSHRVNALWAAHVVHHQSEDMNLAVALRQAPLTGLTAFPFYAPLVTFLPPETVALAAAFNTLYQFWIHTELVGKLGPLEWVLNTPSHHRAHHGINPRYIDRNYGGVLILWDRLFGTFAEETETVVYGTVEPLRSFDPLWAQIQPWVALARTSRRAPDFYDKLRIWFMPPEWAPRGLAPHAPPRPVTPTTRPKWDVAASPRRACYIGVQLATTVIGTFLIVLFRGHIEAPSAGLASGAILVTLFAAAALLERRAWAWPLELSRVALLGTLALVMTARGA